MSRRILVTSALPYANGSIHLGHMLEVIQTDIWVRFQRLLGNECYYVCADDTHGTPIMLRAQADGITPEALIERIGAEHRRDFADFLISFDNYHSTHSADNRQISEQLYLRARAAGHITTRSVRQAYDEAARMFLPDRYVKGECPNCKSVDQYGDACEVCGATYTPADLRNPVSVVSGTAPVWRDSDHYFFRLSAFETDLRAWIASGVVHPSLARKLDEWFTQGLRDWDISRDAPYFGFEIPDAPGKYFYVWWDAPIGYLASFAEFACGRGLVFDDFLAADSKTEMHHFIGKDILYFHALFWPAVLQATGLRRPTAIHAHGFLTVNGTKMSKTRGTFINARRYLERFAPEYLRYYFAAKLGAGIDDIDLNLEEFASRVNSEIVGKLVNIASRCAGFIAKNFAGRLAGSLAEPALQTEFAGAAARIAEAYETLDFAAAMREIMQLADSANQYIDQRKPWALVKDPRNADTVQAVCTQGLNFFRALMIYLKPVLPNMAQAAERFFMERPWSWADASRPRLGAQILAYEALATRLDATALMQLVDDATPAMSSAVAPTDAATLAAAAAVEGNMIAIDEFMRVDLRIGKIMQAEYVDGADKLLRLNIDLGELGSRQIFAGIRHAYDPATLIGRLTIVVANLEPRKMRFGVSEGMVLAAGGAGNKLFLLSPDAGALPGARAK
jgi:methionyl-tRNA synthetase